MDEQIKKAEVLTKFFGIFGYGHFDLSIEEVAHILQLLETKKDLQFLEVNLKELYDRLYQTRMGEAL